MCVCPCVGDYVTVQQGDRCGHCFGHIMQQNVPQEDGHCSTFHTDLSGGSSLDQDRPKRILKVEVVQVGLQLQGN